MDNGKTLGFRGDNDVKYADVVSGGMGMTMVVRLIGGPGSIICSPFMIFQNPNYSYPIRRVPDDIPGVSYRSAKKGFMRKDVWVQWLNEPRAQRRKVPEIKMPNSDRGIFVDNYGGHNDGPEVQKSLSQIRASIRKLLACATDKVQPECTLADFLLRDWLKSVLLMAVIFDSPFNLMNFTFRYENIFSTLQW